jgi:RNA polymerase sigma factor (sigma-70 family)
LGRALPEISRFKNTMTKLPHTDGMSRADKQLAWVAAAQAGCAKAADLLLRSTDRFVLHEVSRFLRHRRPGHTPDDVADLCAEVNAALFERINQFDASKGCGWLTYAAWWIRPACSRWMRINDRIVIEPVKHDQRRGKAFGAVTRLSIQLGRMPTDDELVEETGITADLLQTARESGNAKTVAIEKIERTHACDEVSALDALVQQKQTDAVRALLSGLSERERAVIEMRFGLGDKEEREYRLQEIGEVFGFTRERARQVEARALQKLRQLAMGVDL